MATRLTRRDMLKLSGMLVAGGLLASCGAEETVVPTTAPTEAPPTEAPTEAPTEVPTEAPVSGTVTWMGNRGELSEDQEAQFEEAHPGITMEFINTDQNRFYAMYAAGSPPDVLRVQAPFIPQALARNMLYDLTPYFETSSVLSLADLAPANNYYKANSPLEIGTGPIRGMAKDFSPDFTVYAYTTAFENAGATVPDPAVRPTYQEIADLAAQTAAFEGDRTTMFGYDYEMGWIDRIWMNMAGELDKNIYSADFNQLVLAGDEDIKAIVQYYYDLADANLTANPLNPSPSWIGDDFDKGIVAMVQYGYWFSAMAETDITTGKVVMLLGPSWSGVARDTTMTATGHIVAAATQQADATWVAFEWYNGEEPAIARASSGWGVPALMSMWSMMPNSTPFQQQVQTILQAELAVMDTIGPLQFNPFLGETNVADSWLTNLDRALRGELDFDGLLAAVESDVNTAIQEGIDRIL